MSSSLALFLFALAVGQSPNAPSVGAECPGFENRSTSPLDVTEFYADRAVAIFEAARSGNRTILETLVSSEAEIEYRQGDQIFVGRSRDGASRMVEIAARIEAIRYQVSVDTPGPFWLLSEECSFATTVLFHTSDPRSGARITFSFIDGILVSAMGSEVTTIEGEVR